MKKILKIITLLVLILPLTTKALTYDNVYYNISDYYIDADILENGDLLVNELIVLDGTFNGYIRDIAYRNSKLTSNNYENNVLYNASGIELIDISAKKINGEVSFATINESGYTTLTPNYSANLGYTITSLSNEEEYKMYFATNGKAAFKITYLLKDVAVMHQDVAELYWTFIGDGFDDAINNLHIKVNLPQKDSSSDFRIWAHGDLAGEINKYDDSYCLATINQNKARNPIDIRLTFAKDLLDETSVQKQNAETALPEILKVEEKRADKANQQRKKQQIIDFIISIIEAIILILNYLWYPALLITAIYVYFKYDKEYKSTFTNKYNREFIDDYNVEVIDYLMNKNITPNALSASIMNLVYKKNIRLEEISSDKKHKNYQFTLLNQDNLNDTEKYLVDFLFNRVGKENTFTTEDLKKYASSPKTYDKFHSNYTTWKNKVINDGKKQQFFEKKSKPISLGTIFLVSAFLLLLIDKIFDFRIVSFGILFWAIIFFGYTVSFSKRTKKGNEDYVRWKAFKNFLQDFGNFKIKELPEIILWERYLVYATIFGLAKQVSKNMNVLISEIPEGTYVDYYPSFVDFYIFDSISNSINSAIASNNTAISNAQISSSSSSGGGFGGGFSSGGGFGGGGGGGRGF